MTGLITVLILLMSGLLEPCFCCNRDRAPGPCVCIIDRVGDASTALSNSLPTIASRKFRDFWITVTLSRDCKRWVETCTILSSRSHCRAWLSSLPTPDQPLVDLPISTSAVAVLWLPTRTHMLQVIVLTDRKMAIHGICLSRLFGAVIGVRYGKGVQYGYWNMNS
mmetsp:Transcript_100067/g.223551  ORF Transcript_100067/g.223551 Transcript_100067/m.223551 type:complete len:165 (+) Transcript_100067:2941-3435(+)